MKTILFLCVANSARSQMAEGLARDMYGRAAKFLSAGSAPASLNPYAVHVMAENGIDISAHRSKSLGNIDLAQVDLIITLCADEICPVVPAHAKHLHWPLADPAINDTNLLEGQTLVRFRVSREEIFTRLANLNLNTLD